jgi:glycosyltransferase involved in cell wall biosynthesis
MKKALYFFPDNVGKQTAGNKIRAIHLLKYFNQKGFKVDFVSLKHEKIDQDTEQETIDFLKNSNLADNVFLLPRKPGKKNLITYFFKYKIRDLWYYWVTYPFKSNIPTYLTIRLKSAFENVLKNNDYDYIIISYAQCADLISNKKLIKNAKTIIDTHDFITAQYKGKRNFSLGVTFEDEINRLNLFNEIWAISVEEQYIFNQFCKSQVRLVPIMLDAPGLNPISFNEKKYDVIYVASDNIHNINSSKWFFEKVYPLLPKSINICVIGKINGYINDSYKIERVTYADDLDHYYGNAKVSICPMLTGTGVKVKVVEALAFGIPVVCSSRGVDGLPNKSLNGCLVSDNPIEFAQNITALLNNQVFYNEQSNFAKELFNNSFSKNVIFKELDNAFKE